jgi:hypothetical protein
MNSNNWTSETNRIVSNYLLSYKNITPSALRTNQTRLMDLTG